MEVSDLVSGSGRGSVSKASPASPASPPAELGEAARDLAKVDGSQAQPKRAGVGESPLVYICYQRPARDSLSRFLMVVEIS